MLYEVLKALHIVAVIAWMAGLLYLPRLFVYHADAEKGSKQSETFKIMERRLVYAIMEPAQGAVWILGLLLAWRGDWWASALAQGVRGRPKHETCQLLSLVERGADGVDDRYRIPRGA